MRLQLLHSPCQLGPGCPVSAAGAVPPRPLLRPLPRQHRHGEDRRRGARHLHPAGPTAAH